MPQQDGKEGKDSYADWIVTGFIISMVCGLASGIPGLGWLRGIAALAIVPFVIAALGALLWAVSGLFRD